MVSNRVAFVLLSVACVAAAAGGGYLANRQGTALVAQPEATGATADQLAPPVEETEVLVAEPVPATAPARAEEATQPPAPAARRRVAAAQPMPSPPPTVAEARRPVMTTAPRAVSSPQVPAPDAALGTAAIESEPREPVLGQPLRLPVAEAPVPRPFQLPEAYFHEFVVSADSVVGLQIDSTVTTARARVEDRVDGRVIRDVQVDGDVAIPAGSRAIGSVTLVESGGKFKERARLGIRFHTLVLTDGADLPITTETIYRYGDPPGNGSAARVGGGAVAGAILGAILGGTKGAAVGAATGAGGGAAAVMAGDRNEATFPAGTEVTARILSPVTVTVER